MDVIPVFSTAILVATIGSIILAIVSYAAYKARERRRPNRNFDPEEVKEIRFFHRYLPGADAGDPAPEPAEGRPDHA